MHFHRRTERSQGDLGKIILATQRKLGMRCAS